MIKAILRHYRRTLFIVLLLSLFQIPVSSQLTDDQVKLGLIFNFMKNISWQEEEHIDTFFIATFGRESSLLIALDHLEKMELRGKPIRIKNLRTINDEENYQVLVVMNDKNEHVDDIYKHLQGDDVLLITDRCRLQRYVMINFVYGVDSLIRFEVNSQNIESAGLDISPKLILLGGSEIDIRNLYHETEKTLVTEKERTGQFEKELEAKKKEIEQLNLVLQELKEDEDIMRSEIRSQKNELSKLESKNLNQQENLDDKNQKLSEQKEEIKKREAQLLIKERDISLVQQKIEESNKVLGNLKNEINNRQQTIEDQKYEINSQLARIRQQRGYMFLLALIIVLAVAVIFMIYRIYRNRQLQNIELERQNELVKKQRDQIAEQNHELEMHRNQLENLVQERTRDLIKAKERAEEADRLKSSFLANMSHEIRTPLNAIIGFIDLIFNEKIDKSTRMSYQQIVQINSELLLQLINDILDLAMIESEQLKVVKSEENLAALMETTFSSCKTSKRNILSSAIEFKLELPDKSLNINTDAIRFNQILLNLIDNAIKYTEKGSIEVGFTSDDAKATIYVRDSGIGIRPEHQQSIFDRFIKIENPTTRFYRGIGLGLAIVKKLVEELEGEIYVESEVGKGTCFYFTQPVIKTSSKKIKDGKIVENSTLSFANKTILICEDEDSNYLLLERVLQTSQMTLLRAKNGQEAINICKTGIVPDLILMDIKMPVMDGIEAARIIKKMLGYKNPIIAQTAYATGTDVQKYASSFDDYITKPITREVLFNSLNQYLADPVG